MIDQELRDRCCWKHCPAGSDMLFKGVGLCQGHWSQACSVYKNTGEYILDRVHQTAAEVIRNYQQPKATL